MWGSDPKPSEPSPAASQGIISSMPEWGAEPTLTQALPYEMLASYCYTNHSKQRTSKRFKWRTETQFTACMVAIMQGIRSHKTFIRTGWHNLCILWLLLLKTVSKSEKKQGGRRGGSYTTDKRFQFPGWWQHRPCRGIKLEILKVQTGSLWDWMLALTGVRDDKPCGTTWQSDEEADKGE